MRSETAKGWARRRVLGTDDTLVLEGVQQRQAIARAALATLASPAG